MQKPLSISDIKRWLEKRNPLGWFRDKKFTIRNIDPKAWSGHFNYLVETPKKKFVLRFRGPEWGEASGIMDEFKTLQRVEGVKVGPKVYYLTKRFFGESMIFEEYLEGELLSDLSPRQQNKLFPDVAQFIAKINSIPFRKNSFPFQEPMTSYAKSKKAWRTRIAFILDCKEAKTCGQELFAFLPGIESILNTYEAHLRRVLGVTGPVFIFESSHLGHCLKTRDGFRFFNWEQVSYGDPSYTLAVFLTSLYDRKNFGEVKKEMIDSYLEKKHIPEFAKLVDQRITERRISNVIYGLYMEVKKGASLISNWYRKLETLKEIIKDQH